MSILNHFFGTNKEKLSLNWTIIEDRSQLDDAIELSYHKPVVIFKHSTRCGISKMVLNQFQSNAEFDENEVYLYFLDLLKFRNLSNEIAERFQVYHQSPQMIILKSGEVVHHSSHSEIVPSTINNLIERL